MRLTWRNTFWRRLPRRVCAVVALLAYLLAAVGFPVPAAHLKKSGIPFPCQDHPCGCQSAEQCWCSCCCFTVEQRWAWAREHHVEPPAYAARPSDSEPHAHACAHHAGAPHSACCDKERPADPAKEEQSAPAGGVRWTIGALALGCRGQGTLWITSGAVAPPPAPFAWEPHPAPAGWLSPSPKSPLSLSRAPLDPPPRSTHS
jgi:hypothetical protein